MYNVNEIYLKVYIRIIILSMANKTKTTREEILRVAVQLVREKGMGVLNARALAKIIHCSIQPIYYHFPTMVELRDEVRSCIKQIYNDHISSLKASNRVIHFIDVGFSYLMFAEKEPNFFKVLFMEQQNRPYGIEDATDINLDYILSTIVDEFALCREEALSLMEVVWVTTYGLAVMIASGYMHPSHEKISQILYSSFYGQLKLIKTQNKEV